MYLARVLVGEYTTGSEGVIVPPAKSASNVTDTYDTVVDDVSNPSIYVVFYDWQCYPEYLITFKWTGFRTFLTVMVWIYVISIYHIFPLRHRNIKGRWVVSFKIYVNRNFRTTEMVHVMLSNEGCFVGFQFHLGFRWFWLKKHTPTPTNSVTGRLFTKSNELLKVENAIHKINHPMYDAKKKIKSLVPFGISTPFESLAWQSRLSRQSLSRQAFENFL